MENMYDYKDTLIIPFVRFYIKHRIYCIYFLVLLDNQYGIYILSIIRYTKQIRFICQYKL